VGFQGAHGLFDDLGSGHVPNLVFISPNQCNDQHGRGDAGPVCDFDPLIMARRWETLRTIQQGHPRIDRVVRRAQRYRGGAGENDYSVSPPTNQVLVTVDTNYGEHPVRTFC
jgi:phosphatidylinositol-3-phosphatase